MGTRVFFLFLFFFGNGSTLFGSFWVLQYYICMYICMQIPVVLYPKFNMFMGKLSKISYFLTSFVLLRGKLRLVVNSASSPFLVLFS